MRFITTHTRALGSGNMHLSAYAATPIRFTKSSCKRQWYYACSHSTKQPWRSHYYVICKDWVAKHNRTTRNWVGNCRSTTGSRRQSKKKTILKHFLKGFLEGKSLAPKWRKKTHFVRDFLQNSIGNSSTSTTCNPIYNAGTILQLQITMEFHR